MQYRDIEREIHTIFVGYFISPHNLPLILVQLIDFH